jgi:hypothetical protein
MKRIFFLSILFVTVLVFSVPVLSLAADPLVPCDGPGCRACDLVSLAQNVIRWLIVVMVGVIALVFAIGGFKMVMSAGNPGAVSSARGMMANSVIGFLILLSGWLIVNTILVTLVDSGKMTRPWHTIECTEPLAGPAPAPTPPGECSIPALSAVTDPLAQQMEGGQTVIWTNTDARLQACVNKFTGKVGGSVTSVYRPPAYQTHLYEVKNKWCDQGLRTNTDEACSALKSAVSAEISKHGLSNCGAVAQSNSSHSSGIGVDIAGLNYGSPQVQQAAIDSCLHWNNFQNDPYHFTLRQGCSCN